MNKLLGNIINKFDAEAKSHMERQSLNPFSGNFSRSPSPRLSKDQYGRPLAGSKTEERGQKAKCHILREIQDLCNCIHDLGVYNKTHKQTQDSDDEEDTNDEEIIITFGEIFQMYTKINDKVVGLLIAAKKRGFIFFEKEILFQRRDDDVLIALIKPIAEIRSIINKELAAAKSPVPFQSRDGSPAVGDDSDNEKSKMNGSFESSSKSGSGSPVENNKKGNKKGPRSATPKKETNGTAIELKESVIQPAIVVAAEVPAEVINKSVEEMPNGNNEPVQTPDETNNVPSVSDENMNGITDVVASEEPKTEVVEEHSIPTVNITFEEEPIKIEFAEPIAEQTGKPTEDLIPTIEITEAVTPVRGTSVEPSVNVDEKVNNEEPQSDETDLEKVIAVLESNEIDVIENNNQSEESIQNNDVPKVLLEELSEKEINMVPIEVAEPVPINDIVIPPLSNPDIIQIPIASVIENERKRTFSNEELIESLAAALSGRSSSPDICDEEVEQIFQSQAAVPLLNPALEINVVPENVTSIHDELRDDENTSFQEPIILTPEISEIKTPENLIDEEILPLTENDEIISTERCLVSENTDCEKIAPLPESEKLNSGKVTPNPVSISLIKLSTPESIFSTPEPMFSTPEVEILNLEINQPPSEEMIKIEKPTPETAVEGASSA